MTLLHLFPFTTCEKPLKHAFIMQPVSALINVVCCLILMYYVYMAKTFNVKLMLCTFLCFQAWHAFSHMQHIRSSIQANVIHIIAYTVSATLLYSVISLSGKAPSAAFFAVLIAVLCIDIYVWLHVGGLWMIMTGLSIMTLVVFGNLWVFPKALMNNLICLAVGFLILLAFIINEKINCQYMLQIYELPYHALIEATGLVLFWLLAQLFIQWETIR
jgi:hypothetical protein